ncbi:MAG: EAL domain-containing protein [Oscillibacter sp.]|nr:EAL domain-containing protein [Oscillibacter sp.]
MRDYPYLLCLLLILWIFMACYLGLPHLKNRQNRIFLTMLTIYAGVLTLELIAHPIGMRVFPFPQRWIAVLNIAYRALFLPGMYCNFLFITNILRLNAERAPWKARFLRGLFVVAETLTLSSFLNGIVVHVRPDGSYKGPLYGVLAFCGLFYLILSLVMLTTCSSRLSAYERVSAWASQILLLCGLMIHIFFPVDMILSTAYLMSIIILYLAFQNPNLYMANRGNAFNVRAFRSVMDERLEKNSYRILAFALRDYIDMRGIYGGPQMDSGVSLIGNFLVKTYPEHQVFYLRSGRFVLLGPESMDCEQIRHELHERFQAPWVADDAELDLSIAIVQLEPDSGPDTVDRILNYLFLAFDNADEILSRPDGLMDADSIRLIDRQVDVKRSLDRCLERNEVEIFLQPLIDSRSRNLAGAEVLCRIRDEDGKLISPSIFVPIAEKNGCINLMGEQVLEKACQFVRDHNLEQIGLSWLNVNLSPIQCMKKDLSERFSTILEQYGVSTEIIHLEITEQSVMDISRLEQQIHVLQGFGFRFSLDDYGSGYSNLSRVKQYPFANIKLDMSIVWDYFRDKDVLLPTIVQAFKEMGFSITAEGIETAEMADTMSAIGCDYLQGYYFSKPLPTEEFVTKYTSLRQGA